MIIMLKVSIKISICSSRFVAQRNKNIERGVNPPLFYIRMLIVSLSLVAYVTCLLFISTTALAQNSSTGDIQSEITVVDRKIVPAKANVTIIPLTNITGTNS